MSLQRMFDGGDLDFAAQLFEKIRRSSRITDDDIGVTRSAFNASEERALVILEGAAHANDLGFWRDAGTNLRMSLLEYPNLTHPYGTPEVWIGSHIDSVPEGGNFDGLAGIVAGLLCLRKMKQRNVIPSRPVVNVALRGEESAWFGTPYVGSKAMFGLLTEEDFQRRHRHLHDFTLREAFRERGAVGLRAGEGFVDPQRIAEFWELHIEQGPVLVAKDFAVGTVSSVRGNVRHADIQIMGVAGHSGTTPRELRHDAVFAFASFISLLDASWAAALEHGQDLVVTSGMVSTDETVHGLTRIPENVKFCLEWRSHDKDVLANFGEIVKQISADVEKSHGVAFHFDQPVHTSPAQLDGRLGMRAAWAAAELNIGSMSMSSGAGHDAAVFASVGVPSGMIFVRNEHGSHNPREAMDMDDFMAAVEVLYKVVTITERSW